MKQFVTTAENRDGPIEGAEPLEIDLDGHTLVAQPPTEGQFMVIMGYLGSNMLGEQSKGIGLMLDAVFGPAESRYLTRRLMDRDDPFGPNHLNEIVGWMIGEWQRPTVGPGIEEDEASSGPAASNGSTSSPPSSGRKSKVKRV